MLIKDINACEEIIAGDDSILCEVLHPDKEKIDIRYSLAHAIVKSKETTKSHILATSEVYYILEGEGIMHIDDETVAVHSGQAVYIPPNAAQYIENTGSGDLKFLCIVDPAWKPEIEKIV